MDDYSGEFINQRLLKHQQEIEREEKRNANMLSIYAEITHKMLKEVDNSPKNPLSSLPNGVSIDRKQGSRACYFECDDLTAKEELIDILDQYRIDWQDN